MFVARVFGHCSLHLKTSMCVSHQNLLRRFLAMKVSQPHHVSSATRRLRQLDTASKTTRIRSKPPKIHNATLNVDNFFSKDPKESSNGEVESDGSGPDSERETSLGAFTPRNIASVALTNFRSKLANYDGFTFSHEQWKSLESEICSENPALQKSWATHCMGLMLHVGCLQLASSLMDYLEAQEAFKPSITTLSLYIALQGKHGNESKEQIISECCSKVKEISDVFDGITAKFLIWGLSATSRWKESLDILEMAKMTVNTGPSFYSPIIQAAFREGETELGFKLLDELASDGHQPQEGVVHEMLRVCRATGSNVLLDRYLTSYMWQYNWFLSPSLASEFEQYFTQSENERWTCKWTHVQTVSGICQSCKHSLPRIELSSSDFESLQREFLEKALVGENVYLKSNPKEVERFCDFVQENAPFDIVLDALNVSQVTRQQTKSKQLREIVHYFAREKYMQVLVLGRVHMMKWPAADMKYIQRHAKTFFTDNISSDDPFCLYATLYSGKDCLFMSRDFMRNHKFNMGLRFKDVFERWQKSRQILNFWVDQNRVLIKMPSQYDCGPVKDDRGWHIPYDDGNLRPTATTQAVLCLRLKGQRAKSARRKMEQSDG